MSKEKKEFLRYYTVVTILVGSNNFDSVNIFYCALRKIL